MLIALVVKELELSPQVNPVFMAFPVLVKIAEPIHENDFWVCVGSTIGLLHSKRDCTAWIEHYEDTTAIVTK